MVVVGGGWWWSKVILVLSFGLSQAEQFGPELGKQKFCYHPQVLDVRLHFIRSHSISGWVARSSFFALNYLLIKYRFPLVPSQVRIDNSSDIVYFLGTGHATAHFNRHLK